MHLFCTRLYNTFLHIFFTTKNIQENFYYNLCVTINDLQSKTKKKSNKKNKNKSRIGKYNQKKSVQLQTTFRKRIRHLQEHKNYDKKYNNSERK